MRETQDLLSKAELFAYEDDLADWLEAQNDPYYLDWLEKVHGRKLQRITEVDLICDFCQKEITVDIDVYEEACGDVFCDCAAARPMEPTDWR